MSRREAQFWQYVKRLLKDYLQKLWKIGEIE